MALTPKNGRSDGKARKGVHNTPRQNRVLCQNSAKESQDSPGVAIPDPPMTRTLVTGFFTDPMFATTPQKVGQQTLDRLHVSPADRKYSQAVNDKGQDVSGTCLSPTL